MATLTHRLYCSLVYIYCKLQLSILRNCLFLVARRLYTVLRIQIYANGTQINYSHYLDIKSPDMLH